jgi:hypothetical protein
MRTGKTHKSPSGFTRGEKVVARAGRRHGRKTRKAKKNAEDISRSLDILTPL